MSSRGRGYGERGGYAGRGGGYRGSYRGNNRGGYESRGAGYSSYHIDNRYNSSQSNRYSSSRDRVDGSYKKSYHSELSDSYSNHDYGGRSDSPERKRMRIESSLSERRYDGGQYGGYSSRQENYGERRSFGEDRRRSPARESFRTSGGMGPPRRPFRGWSLRSRGTYRGVIRSRGSFSRRYSERPTYLKLFRSVKGRSLVKSKDEASSTEKDWEREEKEEVIEVIKKVSPKPQEKRYEADRDESAEDTEKEDAASDAPPAKTYVKLVCVHCKEKCSNFRLYTKHLLSLKHKAIMSSVARRRKAQSLRMKVAQRNAQRELEAAAGAELASKTNFCLVCHLNHRTTRHAHNLTDSHQAMKRFLNPFCRICRVTFQSPMMYEHHICSIEHLKKKAYRSAQRESPKKETSADEGMDVDLDNFMTLDSVGDVDELEDEDSGTEDKDEVKPKKPKAEINIGSEHIKKIEVWWCSLCRIYLPRAEAGSEEEASALRRHCRLRAHLRLYVHHRDTRTLRKQAERIHRQLHTNTEKEKENATENATKEKVEQKKSEPIEEKKAVENGTDAYDDLDYEDKLWADVDRDIGDLLREVDCQSMDLSDDDEELERYCEEEAEAKEG